MYAGEGAVALSVADSDISRNGDIDGSLHPFVLVGAHLLLVKPGLRIAVISRPHEVGWFFALSMLVGCVAICCRVNARPAHPSNSRALADI